MILTLFLFELGINALQQTQRGEKQVNAMKFGPEDNGEAASYMDTMKIFQLTSLRNKWSHEEKDITQEFHKAKVSGFDEV